MIHFGWSLLTINSLIRPEADSVWHHDFQDVLESCLHGLGKQTKFLGPIIFVMKVMFFGTIFVCKNNNTVCIILLP